MYNQNQRANQFVLALVMLLLFTGCQPSDTGDTVKDFSSRKIKIVATTSMIADLVTEIGGDRVEVAGLMGPGVDPPLYKASEGDVLKMAGADLVVYNGLHLEGKMTEVFEQMAKRSIPTLAVAQDAVPDSLRLMSATYAGNFDPHVWFDVTLWQQVADHVHVVLGELSPTHQAIFAANAAQYIEQLEALHTYVTTQAAAIPASSRVLITSHDAFGYFGRAYGFDVHALQGLSTTTEAGTADVQELADFVATNRIPAMFVESSVSPRGIEAVKAAVGARDFEVQIGGYLYSDALGDPESPEGTYIGTVRYNIDTIVAGLKQ
ncbi:MAG: zinc ABC transporter substrate-binding protein [Bacteroidota bacterium]